jgi:ankyrin repeat protein
MLATSVSDDQNHEGELLAAFAFSIVAASARGHTQVVKLLLQDPRTDPTVNNGRAIVQACCNGHTGVVQLLLSDPRVDPSTRVNDAIHGACMTGSVAIVKMLLQDTRVNPATDNSRGLLFAR